MTLLLLIVLEKTIPRTRLRFSRLRRWPNHAALSTLNFFTERFLWPWPLAWISTYAAVEGIGLFQIFDVPEGVEIILGILILDLAIYFQHWASHNWNWFWRLHRVHHLDPDFDVTTAIRFHPAEIWISLLWKVCIILAFGLPFESVFLFEIILSTCALFNHTNFNLGAALDKKLRWFIVTPDMHRLHHSQHPRETNSNYGTILTCWDHFFGSYIECPPEEVPRIPIGLKTPFGETVTLWHWLLRSPFIKWAILFIPLFGLAPTSSWGISLKLMPHYSPKNHNYMLDTDWYEQDRPHRHLIQDRLFTRDLIIEIRKRYEQKFGPLESSNVSYAFPVEDVKVLDQDRLTEREKIDSEIKQTQDFGEFVFRRTMEFHLDRKLKTNPEARPVYKVKERLTKANLQISEKIKLLARYSISGNFASLKLSNPLADLEAIWDMGGPSRGPRVAGVETTYRLEKDLGQKRSLTVQYKTIEETLSATLKKVVSEVLSTTLTVTSYYEKTTLERDTLALVGFVLAI